MQSASLPAPTMAPTRNPQGGMLERVGEHAVQYTSDAGERFTFPYDGTTDGGGWVTILQQTPGVQHINPGSTVVNEFARKHGTGILRYLVNGQTHSFYRRNGYSFDGFDLYANLAEMWSSVSNEFALFSTYTDLARNRNAWGLGTCTYNEEGKGYPNTCRALSSQPSNMWTEFHGPELPHDGGGQQNTTIQLKVVRPLGDSNLLLSLACNDTAGSTVVRDYSGNNFPVFSRTDTDISPTFNGRAVRLASAYRQYLTVDPVFSLTMKRLSSFTFTASVNLASTTNTTIMRLFEFTCGAFRGRIYHWVAECTVSPVGCSPFYPLLRLSRLGLPLGHVRPVEWWQAGIQCAGKARRATSAGSCQFHTDAQHLVSSCSWSSHSNSHMILQLHCAYNTSDSFVTQDLHYRHVRWPHVHHEPLRQRHPCCERQCRARQPVDVPNATHGLGHRPLIFSFCGGPPIP